VDLEIIAHRGFSVMAPENTLVAFTAALQQGANSIECDLQISADGVPVIFHDATLNRITGTSGTIREKTIAELKQLDAGAWFAEQFAGEGIPTLEEAVAGFKMVKDFLYFDVKPESEWSDREVDDLGHLLTQEDLLTRSIMTSFNEGFLGKIREFFPEISLGYFITDVSNFEQQLQKAVAVKNAILSVYYPVILEQPQWVEESRKQGVDVVVWTVDSLEDVKQLRNVGVRRIITNSLIGNFEA
jgi:glycerophosphoryl diester phosphodiesterase